MKTYKQSIFLVLLAIILFVGLIFIGSTTLESARSYSSTLRNDWKNYTSPLPEETIRNLCKTLELINTEVCTSGNEVYAGDFYPFLKDQLAPINETPIANFDDTILILGEYLIGCEYSNNIEPNEGEFSCTFDIRGDNIYNVGAYFDEQKNLTRLDLVLEWP